MSTAPPLRPRILSSVTCRRGLSLLLLPLCAHSNARVFAQADPSRLPSTLPTSAAAYSATNSPPRTARRAEVTYLGGLLTVAATNSSLNQILREIARQTGMKVTGRVAEDRVFGTYGPAPPSTVLATLLDGTGTNLLMVQDASHAPTELILTPRIGGVTPPNPNAPSFENNDSSAEDAPQFIRPAPIAPAQPASSPPANSRASDRTGTGGIDTNPAATAPSSTTQQLAFPPVDATTPPATATITPTTPDPAPDSVKTPQQIFEQLQRLRQRQIQQPKPQ